MCERVPRQPSRPPARSPTPAALPRAALAEPALPGLARRAFLLGVGGVVLGACTGPACPTLGRYPIAGAAPPGAPPRPAPPPHVPGPRPLPPQVRTPTYRVVRREQWGAADLRANHDPMARVSRLTLHHTAMEEEIRGRDDAQALRDIQAFHQDVRGWADIGYHWLVGRDGNIYEGRRLGVQGAHAGGENNVENLGISVIGDFSTQLPEPLQLATVEAFLLAEIARYSLTSAGVFGHRDLKATACPGDSLYAWLGAFKSRVA